MIKFIDFGEMMMHSLKLLVNISFILLVVLSLGFAQGKKYPSALYLVGEGYAENTSNPEDGTIAKERAMSDLANQIQASVKSEFVSELTEASNSIVEYAESKVNVISDMKIEGVRWETFDQGEFIMAQAILSKDEAAELYYERTKELQKQIDANMNRVTSLMGSGDNDRALMELFATSKLFNQLEQNILIYMILGGRNQKELKPTFSRSHLDDHIYKLTETDINSFDDAINGLCFQISKQIQPGQKITVFPFDFQDTAFGSALSDYIRQQINFNLNKFIKFQQGKIEPGSEKREGLTIAGNYWLRASLMEIILLIYDESGSAIGSARVEFPISFAEKVGVAYKPQNFVDASAEDKLFSKSEVVYGDLNVDFWTNKGDQNIIFRGGEEMHLYVRLNTPAYLRFIYHLANGMRTPLYTSYYIDQSKVNKIVELPDVFECAPPFGVEKLQMFASTEELPDLNLKTVEIEGESYDVLADDLGEFLAKTRGFVKKKTGMVKKAERVLTITTVAK
ncbi:MAG: DUF4384 domain-containing protein [Calditrichaceae bacterium]|nr:DUF4384 domain-containing protein [Calditrichaceae bacterium]